MKLFARLFGSNRVAKNTVNNGVSKKTKSTIQEVVQKAEVQVENAVQATIPKGPSLGSRISNGLCYYGVLPDTKPIIERFTGLIVRKYPCQDGGTLVVEHVTRVDGSSRLDICKTGNPDIRNRGDYYRHFYAETAVRHFKDWLGHDGITKVRKKGATKQVLSSRNGVATDDVHVPLKRWEITKDSNIGSGKRVDNQVNPWNPRDFDRFCD